VKQDPALVTKAPKIKKEFGLIDWTKPAEYIERFVRAMQPWPTAYTFLHRPGKEPMRVIVTGAYRGKPNCSGLEYPAGAISVIAGVMGVYTGTGQVVIIDELQPAGKKRMNAAEFLRGHPEVEGMRFGPEVPS
jgi:methionyl-tRNA formyltransferase